MFLIIFNGYFTIEPVIIFTADLIDFFKLAFLPGDHRPPPNLLLRQPVSYLLMAAGSSWDCDLAAGVNKVQHTEKYYEM